jgi:hypothetical protein
MATFDQAGDAVRKIAGYLPYNPGPGIYSRLERAIQAMPENVRTQELPGLLKRYKEGVPGWELKATDLDSVIAGRDVMPREELLTRVKERSPVYTHKEVVLADELPTVTLIDEDVLRRSKGGITQSETITLPQYQEEASPLGRGIGHGDPKYQAFGQGGTGYTELLLAQPGARAGEYGNHWRNAATQYVDAAEDAVAHARYDTHGDALRINELQSDLGIHNRKAREIPESYEPPGAFDRVARGRELPFPLEDTWADLLIKRLALEAARKGHRAIEVASPRAIADKVGGNIDNYEHFYGKVVPGALERLGRKMGGLTEEPIEQVGPVIRYELPFNNGQGVLEPRAAAEQIFRREFPQAGPLPAFEIDPRRAYEKLEWAYSKKPESVGEYATILQATLAKRLQSAGVDAREAERLAGQRMPEIVRLAEEQAMRANAYDRVQTIRDVQEMQPGWKASRSEAGKRYIMSDEMRRRILTQGIGAAVAAPMMSDDDLIERLNK